MANPRLSAQRLLLMLLLWHRDFQAGSQKNIEFGSLIWINAQSSPSYETKWIIKIKINSLHVFPVSHWFVIYIFPKLLGFLNNRSSDFLIWVLSFFWWEKQQLKFLSLTSFSVSLASLKPGKSLLLTSAGPRFCTLCPSGLGEHWLNNAAEKRGARCVVGWRVCRLQRFSLFSLELQNTVVIFTKPNGWDVSESLDEKRPLQQCVFSNLGAVRTSLTPAVIQN